MGAQYPYGCGQNVGQSRLFQKGEQLATMSADQTAKLWDLTQCYHSFRALAGSAVAFGVNDNELFLGRGNNLSSSLCDP